MDAATIECIQAALSEALGLAAITAIIALLRGGGAEVLATSAFRRLLQRLLRGFTKRGLGMVLPWLGVALIIAEIVVLIKDCL